MTAFAHRELQTNHAKIICEIRSVNHRYLKIKSNLPETLYSLEDDLKQILAKQLKRGTIDCHIQIKTQQSISNTLAINKKALKQLKRLSQQIQQIFPNTQELSIQDILSWQGVLISPPNNQLNKEIQKCCKKTLKSLLKAKEREGIKLQRIIIKRLRKMTQKIAMIKDHTSQTIANKNHHLKQKIKQISTTTNTERLEQELVFIAQRLDIDEELDRLQAHLKEIERLVNKNKPVGRKLDFFMQELNREVNTIASKSASKEISKQAIQMKVLIEQMREQVQNIE